MIDLNYKPHESGVLIDRLPHLITQAAAGGFEEQTEALRELRHIQRIGIESLEFVSTHREFWLVEKADQWGAYEDEFNALNVFLSGITKSVSDTIALVEQDSDYERESFFDSKSTVRQVQQHAEEVELRRFADAAHERFPGEPEKAEDQIRMMQTFRKLGDKQKSLFTDIIKVLHEKGADQDMLRDVIARSKEDAPDIDVAYLENMLVPETSHT